MKALVFRCDPAAAIRKRAYVLLGVSCLLWSVVSFYLPWATIGFMAVAWYFARLRHLGKSHWIEVSLTVYDFRVRRLDEDNWTLLAHRPRIWGAWVVAPVPEHIVPFGMLWLGESMLGERLFRELRRVAREAA